MVGSFQAAGVVPGHVLKDVDVRIDVFRAFHVAQRELADERDVHPTDEADLAGLRRHGGRHADKEGALVLLEDHGTARSAGPTTMSIRVNLVSGNSCATVLDGRRLGEAHRHHHLRAAPRHVAQRLLAHGGVRDFELAVLDAGVRLELFGAVEGGLVERFVELAAHVEDDGRREVIRLSHAARDDSDRRERGDDESFHEESPLSLRAHSGCVHLSRAMTRCLSPPSNRMDW